MTVSEGGDIGQTIGGRYSVESLLGRGGMATVYRARHVVTGRYVALKLLHPRPEWNPVEVERFLREARIATRLGHPNVVEVYDAGTDEDGVPFVAMELLEGETLRALLEREGRVDVAAAVRVSRAVLSALAAAHAVGVVHRDVKPENVFLARAGDGPERVLLLDFGISKVLKSHLGTLDPHTLTEAGMLVGTLAYMSPEQLRGDDVDVRTDLWSTGVMLFEMLAGRSPFSGKTVALLTMSVLMTRAPALDAAVRGVPAPLVDLVARLLSPTRERRPPDAHEVIQALDAVRSAPALHELVPTPITLPAPPPSPARWAVVAIAAAVTALALLAGAVALRPRSPTPRRAALTSVTALPTPAAVALAPAAPVAASPDRLVAPSPAAPRRPEPVRRARLVPRADAGAVARPSPGAIAPMQPATDLDGT